MILMTEMVKNRKYIFHQNYLVIIHEVVFNYGLSSEKEIKVTFFKSIWGDYDFPFVSAN